MFLFFYYTLHIVRHITESKAKEIERKCQCQKTSGWKVINYRAGVKRKEKLGSEESIECLQKLHNLFVCNSRMPVTYGTQIASRGTSYLYLFISLNINYLTTRITSRYVHPFHVQVRRIRESRTRFRAVEYLPNPIPLFARALRETAEEFFLSRASYGQPSKNDRITIVTV